MLVVRPTVQLRNDLGEVEKPRIRMRRQQGGSDRDGVPIVVLTKNYMQQLRQVGKMVGKMMHESRSGHPTSPYHCSKADP